MILLFGVLLVMAGVVFELRQRIKRLEKRVEGSADLVKAANHLGESILGLGPEDAQAQNLQDSLEIVDRIGARLSAHAPALRRVLRFSIGIDLTYLRKKTEITIEDLKGLEQQLAPAVFWPANDMIIEEWSTHTEVWDHFGRRAAFYPGETNSWEPELIWRHVLPEDESSEPRLEIVLHEGSIKLWALGGRFDCRWGNASLALGENVLVDIPLSETRLVTCRWQQEPSEDPEFMVPEHQWLRRYAWGDLRQGEHTRWVLNVTDFVTRAANS